MVVSQDVAVLVDHHARTGAVEVGAVDVDRDHCRPDPLDDLGHRTLRPVRGGVGLGQADVLVVQDPVRAIGEPVADATAERSGDEGNHEGQHQTGQAEAPDPDAAGLRLVRRLVLGRRARSRPRSSPSPRTGRVGPAGRPLRPPAARARTATPGHAMGRGWRRPSTTVTRRVARAGGCGYRAPGRSRPSRPSCGRTSHPSRVGLAERRRHGAGAGAPRAVARTPRCQAVGRRSRAPREPPSAGAACRPAQGVTGRRIRRSRPDGRTRRRPAAGFGPDRCLSWARPGRSPQRPSV